MIESEYYQMKERGETRYNDAIAKQIANGKFSDTNPGNHLMSLVFPKMKEAVDIRFKEMKQHHKRNEVTKLLEAINYNKYKSVYLMLAIENIIDEYYLPRRRTTLATSIGRSIELELRMIQLKKNNGVEFDYLVRKMKKWSFNIEAAKSCYLLKNKKLVQQPQILDNVQKAMIGSFILDVAIDIGLVKAVRRVLRDFKDVYYIEPIDEVLLWLDKINEHNKKVRVFYMPIKHLPVEYENPYIGGYVPKQVPTQIIKFGSKDHQNVLMKAKMPDFYKVMTLISRIGYEVNKVVFDTMLHFYKNGSLMPFLPVEYDPKYPEPPGENATKAQHKAYFQEKGLIKSRFTRNFAERQKISNIIKTCNYLGNDTFYFPVKADSRGRIYHMPTTISPIGNNLQRAMTRFADSCLITEANEKWLRINVANHYGLDKKSYEERVKWTYDNEKMILEIAKDPVASVDLWVKADAPWTFLAAAHEFGQYLMAKKQGKDFYSHLPVYLDCTASGFQHLSLLAGSSAEAQRVNVLPSDIPQDIYTDTAKALLEHLKTSDDGYAKHWVTFFNKHPKAMRLVAKKIVMTTPYSVSPHSARIYVSEGLVEYHEQIGEDYDPNGRSQFALTSFLARSLMKVISSTNKMSFAIMNTLKDVAKVTITKSEPIVWTTPSGFVCYQKACKKKVNKVVCAIGKTRKIVPYIADFTTEVSKVKTLNSIVPNFIHSLDAALLHKTVLDLDKSGVKAYSLIHDAFGVLCNDVEKLNKSVRITVANIYSRDIIKEFTEEVLGKKHGIDLPVKGDLDVNKVLESKYFIS